MTVIFVFKSSQTSFSLSFLVQFVVFKPRSYCFKETIGFDVKVSFARPLLSRLIKPGGITTEF